MGTQRSSVGPKSGVPFIPSWVEPVPEPDGNQPQPPPQDIAPAQRFNGARRSLGNFAQSGNGEKLRSGVGHYVRSGLGGSALGGIRMAGTASAAGKIFGGLTGFSAGEARPPEFASLNRSELAGRPAREVGDRIIDAVCPIDGTQDTEARRDSLSRAISELTEQFPEIDLTALTSEQISFLLQGFIAHDICHRIELDIGKTIFDKAPDLPTAVNRMEEIQQYVREKVDATFRDATQAAPMTRATAANITQSIIRDTLRVFEDYL